MTYYIKIGTEAWIELGAFQFAANPPWTLTGKIASSTRPGEFRVRQCGTGERRAAGGPHRQVPVRRNPGHHHPRHEPRRKQQEQAIYDMVLGAAAITELNENMVGGPSLQLVFNEIAITTYTIDGANQVSQPDGTFVWDVTTNDGTPESLPAMPDVGTEERGAGRCPGQIRHGDQWRRRQFRCGGPQGLVRHFGFCLQLRADLRHRHGIDFNVVEYQFSVMVTDQTALTALMSLAANDKLISAVEIEGLSSTDILQTQTLFGNVRIESIEDDGGNGYSVNFLYQQIVSDMLDPFGTNFKSHTEFDFALQKNEATSPRRPASLRDVGGRRIFPGAARPCGGIDQLGP